MGKPTPLAERFWAKVDRWDPDDCWEWIVAKNRDGYGVFHNGRQSVGAHRFAYEMLVGPIPEGLELDHLCRNPACVNPKHLEPVTGRENKMRGRGAPARNLRKTHCKYGHPFDESNTYRRRDRDARQCKECYRRSWRELYQRKKAVA